MTTSQFNGYVDDVLNLHTAFPNIGDAGSELVLLRRCEDVCKVRHFLRVAGQFIAPTSLHNFDAQLDRAFNIILGGSLKPEPITQASLSVKLGGVGVRRVANCHPRLI